MIELKEKIRRDMDGYESIEDEIQLDGETIGTVSLMVSDADAYVERIDIDEEYRNQGYGTEALSQIKHSFDTDVYIAADNEDAKRLYDRIGYEVTYGDAMMYDQGYGVNRL